VIDHMAARPSYVERAAAVLAIAALASAIVLVVVGALSSWQGVVTTVIGLLMIVVAGWYVVARSGLTRILAMCAVPLGALLLVVGFIVASMSTTRVISIFALVALSIGSARVALHRSARSLRRTALSRTPAPPARQPVLIINPRSGDGKAETVQLVERCHERGIDPILLTPGDDLVALAETAISRGADVIGMAGGDGSQAQVASVAIRHDVPHVVVPAGTRNHFALDLGLDRTDVVGALDSYHDGVEHRVDLAVVNGRVFVNNASVGLYAKIVQSAGYRHAKRETALDVLPQLLGPNAVPMDLRFRGPDGTAYPTAQVVMVSNNPYDLDRLTGRGTRERIDGGVLGIVAARISSARDLSRFIALEAAGRPRRLPGWLEWTATQFRLDSDAPIEIGLDGEALTLDPPLLFETVPRALRVRIPRHAIGRSPTAKAVHVLSQSTIVQLSRVATGRRPSAEPTTQAING
jgi:diacylglycerol kinase family enzyme